MHLGSPILSNLILERYETTSYLANHLIFTDHSFIKNTGVKILHCSKKGEKLNNLGALEIKKIT